MLIMMSPAAQDLGIVTTTTQRRLSFTNLVAKEIYDSVLMDREPIEIRNSKFSSRISKEKHDGLIFWLVCSVDVVTVAPAPAVDGGPVGDVEDEEEDREDAEEDQVGLGESEEDWENEKTLENFNLLASKKLTSRFKVRRSKRSLSVIWWIRLTVPHLSGFTAPPLPLLLRRAPPTLPDPLLTDPLVRLPPSLCI